MPVYNAAVTVQASIRSLLSQTYDSIEILIVDDGSDDDSLTAIGTLGDARITVLKQEHRGLARALNHGCAKARGAYVARLDADDVTDSGRVAAQVAYLEVHPEVGLLGTWAKIETEEGKSWTLRSPLTDRALRRYLLWDNPFVHSSVMFRRMAFESAGGYPEEANEDYRLWVQIARDWKLAVLPEFLVTHRVRRASLSRTLPRAKALVERLTVQRQAARVLGPWHLAIPALGVAGSAYVLALMGGALEATARGLVRRTSARARGFRDTSSGDWPK